MSSPKTLNATVLILTAAGLVLIAIAAIVTLEARPTLPPAGSVSRGAASGHTAASGAALRLL